MNSYLTELETFCKTERQREVLAEVINCNGNMAEASRNLKGNRNLANQTIRSIQKHAAKQGFAPEHDMNHTVPESHFVKGVSTLYDQSGNVKMQWVKSNKEAESIAETLQIVADELSESIKPLPAQKETISLPKGAKQFLNLHVLTDYHIGMFSWKEISGDDWSTSKAEAFLLKWFQYAIDNSPPAKYGLLLNLGDFFHSDSVDPVTPASKHALDVDSSYHLMVRTGIRLIKQIVQMMKKKYQTVLIYNVAGNHDFSSTIWLKELFASYYELDKNVIVEDSADIYHAYQHGDTSLFFHHGHKKSVKNVESTFISKFRKIYGSTKHSYGHLGHFHHSEVKESNTMVLEQHRTMAAKDTYAANGGYLSGRSAYVITYHSSLGEVSRLNVSADLIESLL